MDKLLGLIPVAQSVALAGHSMKFANKKDKDALDFMRHGTETIVGARLMGSTADVLGSF